MKRANPAPPLSPVDRLLAEKAGVRSSTPDVEPAAEVVAARVPERDEPSSAAAAEDHPASLHLALLLAPAALLLAVVGLGLAGRDGVAASEGLAFGLVIVWTAAGSILATRRPMCRLGALLLTGTVVGAAAFAGANASRDAGWTGTGRDVAAWVAAAGALALPAIALHALLALPNGRLARPSRRGLVIAGYAVAAVGAGVVAISGDGPGDVPTVVLAAAWVLAVAAGLPGAHQCYLATAGLERQRLQWVGCAAAVVAEAVLVIGALSVLVDWPRSAGVPAGVVTGLIPVAIAAGAFRRLAAGVDRLLVHTVSLAGLTAVTVAAYLVVVVGLGGLQDGTDRRLLGFSMAAAALAALLYVPARERLGDVANRLVYGERHAPDEVLRTFGSRLTRAIPLDELLLQLAESLRKTLGLSRAEVWTGTPELLERAVSVPYAEPVKLVVGDKERTVVARAGVSGPAWVAVWLPALLEGRSDAPLRVAPITHSGELLGLIVVERTAGADGFDEAAEDMLTELARQVGLALHNVQLDAALQATLDEVRHANDELRASRARIVASGDAERRKIERNLHDGAQQHLVALAVNLRLVRDLVAEDPELAAEMLEQLDGAVKDTIAELRNLAHGIYPPLLVDAGLGAALQAAAGRSPLSVEVETDDVGRYSPELEAAVYFCCLEALQNAAKHAPDVHVSVRVWEEAGGLLFDVADDGPGYDADVARRGHGFVNMSDRLGAIGGSVRWDSAPGHGARVSGSVPLG